MAKRKKGFRWQKTAPGKKLVISGKRLRKSGKKLGRAVKKTGFDSKIVLESSGKNALMGVKTLLNSGKKTAKSGARLKQGIRQKTEKDRKGLKREALLRKTVKKTGKNNKLTKAVRAVSFASGAGRIGGYGLRAARLGNKIYQDWQAPGESEEQQK